MLIIRFIFRIKDKSYFTLSIFLWRIVYDCIIFAYLYIHFAYGDIEIVIGAIMISPIFCMQPIIA